MTDKEFCLQQLKSTKEFFDRSTRPLTEEHSAYKPAEGMYTVTEHVAHVAQTIEWFVKGLFSPQGFDMDFEKAAKEAAGVTSLAEARKWLDRACAEAVSEMEKRPWSDWDSVLPDNPILGPVPRWTAIGAILDHTVHHRGALTVYSRMLGLTPPMPYMEM